MNRLTQRDEYGFVDLLKEDNQVFKEFEQYANNDALLDRLNEALYKLADYEDLEEQQQLIKLPCKPQSKLYTLKDYCKIRSVFYIYDITDVQKTQVISSLFRPIC